MKILLLLFFCSSLTAQQLHHQMLSAQGGVSTTSKGVKVSQTIAQQSTVGNKSLGNNFLIQGFQQSKISNKTLVEEINGINTLVYPNPVADFVHFKFSSPMEGKISMLLYDIHGRLLLYQEKEAIDNLVTLTNLQLADGEYFVKLKAKKYSFTTKIIKTK